MFLNNQKDFVESSFNIGLTIEPNKQSIVKKYLFELLNLFCNELNLDLNLLRELPFEKCFTDVEFNKIIPDDKDESFINQYFYPKVFDGIKKLDVNQFDFFVKYCFTLDKALTPNTTSIGIDYGKLLLGNKPVLYYIFVDIQKVFEKIKAN